MNLLLKDTVPLSNPVKAAAIDMGEDLSKVEATYSHLAVRGYKDLSNKILRLGYYRGIATIHPALRTVAIPLGAKNITFVGWVDECGVKHSLREKTNLVGSVSEITECGQDCIDKCRDCGQSLDICENLQVTEDKENVSITDSTGTHIYQNITTKYYENGKYYLVKKRWVLDQGSNLAREVTTTDFITDFDLLNCGCIAPTKSNLDKIRGNCYSCYCTCFTPCVEDSEDIVGGYRVLEDYIQLDKNVSLDKIYLEWEGALPKKGNSYHIPAIAVETIIAYIKHRATWNKKSMSLTERDQNRKDYINKFNDCKIIISRVSIDAIKNSFRKVPKISYSLGTQESRSCDEMQFTSTPYSDNQYFYPQVINTGGGGTVVLQDFAYVSLEFDVVGLPDGQSPEDGQNIWYNPLFVGAEQLATMIVNNQLETIGSDFTFNNTTGEITRSNTFYLGDKIVVSFLKKVP